MGGRLDDVVGGPLPPVGEWGRIPSRLDLYESVRAFVAQKQLAPPKEVGRRLVQGMGRRAQRLLIPFDRERMAPASGMDAGLCGESSGQRA